MVGALLSRHQGTMTARQDITGTGMAGMYLHSVAFRALLSALAFLRGLRLSGP